MTTRTARPTARRGFSPTDADRTMYIYAVEPRGVHTSARITITNCGADGFHVRFETIARAYTHYGFVASPEQDKHAETWAKAADLAAKFVAQYEVGEP